MQRQAIKIRAFSQNLEIEHVALEVVIIMKKKKKQQEDKEKEEEEGEAIISLTLTVYQKLSKSLASIEYYIIKLNKHFRIQNKQKIHRK